MAAAVSAAAAWQMLALKNDPITIEYFERGGIE